MFRGRSRRQSRTPEVLSLDLVEAAARDAIEQVTSAIDSIDALGDVRSSYVRSVFTSASDENYGYSANQLSETAKAYTHHVSALSELACTAALKLTQLPDEPGEPYATTLYSALTRGISAHEASERVIAFGREFTDLTGSERLQERFAYEYHAPDFMFAFQLHAIEQGDQAAKQPMSNGSVTESTITAVKANLFTAMNLEELIGLQEYTAAIDIGLRDITE